MADVFSFFVHKQTHELAVAFPTSHADTAKFLKLGHVRGHHTDWETCTWKRYREIEGGDEELRAAVLERFRTREAFLEWAKLQVLDFGERLITRQDEAEALTEMPAGERLVVDGDVLVFRNLRKANGIAVGSRSQVGFPALREAGDLMLWGAAHFPLLRTAGRVLVWGRATFDALAEADDVVIMACGQATFPTLRHMPNGRDAHTRDWGGGGVERVRFAEPVAALERLRFEAAVLLDESRNSDLLEPNRQ